jgi:hypothetical protein
MGILARINGKGPGADRLFASVGAKRFPATVSLTNTGTTPAQVELRVRPGAGAKLRMDEAAWTIPAGSGVETSFYAETPSQAEGDTVVEILADGAVEAEFRFTAVWLARESVFHRFGSESRDR